MKIQQSGLLCFVLGSKNFLDGGGENESWVKNQNKGLKLKSWVKN